MYSYYYYVFCIHMYRYTIIIALKRDTLFMGIISLHNF